MEYIWNVTGRCNLKCSYCWDPFKSEKEMTFDECCCLVEQLVLNNCETIIFTGGEPTVRKDLFDIAEYAYLKGVSNLKICTNGVNLVEIGERLKQSPIHEIHISINDPVDITGRDDSEAFQRTIVDLIANHKKVVFVTIAEWFQLEKYKMVFQLAKGLGVLVNIQFMTSKEDTFLKPDAVKYSDIFKEIQEIHNLYSKQIEPYMLNFCNISKKYYCQGVIPKRCRAGEEFKIISPAGNIRNCYWREEYQEDIKECFSDKCLVWFRYNRRVAKIYEMFSKLNI